MSKTLRDLGRSKGYADPESGTCPECGSTDAELSRLRGVVEAVQALADEWERRATDPSVSRSCIADLRATLAASVGSSGEAPRLDLPDAELDAMRAEFGSSGEAESGEGDPAAQQLLRDIFGKHEDDTPAPVPSGGQADEAAVDAILTEHFGHTVYEATGDQPEECHDECPACLAGEQISALLAARPVLSREAIERVLRPHGVYGFTGDEIACVCDHKVWRDRQQHRLHLADVLTAGSEQA